MYKLACALIFVASATPVMAATAVNNAAFGKARPGGDSHAFVTKAARLSARGSAAKAPASSLASSRRRTSVRARSVGAPELRRTAAGKLSSTSNASALGARNRARPTATKRAGRGHGLRPALAAPGVVVGRTRGPRGAGRVTFPSGASLPVVKGPDRAGQEFYDPNKSGNPLLDTSGAHRLKMLSGNFSVAELARSGDKAFGVARIDPRQITCLQNIRNYVGRPVLVGSGYRSYWHNIEVYRRLGRRPTISQHLSGRAADIRVEGMTGVEIAKAAIDACGPEVAVGLGPSYAHIDVRGNSGVWKYKGVTAQEVAEVERHRATRRLALRVRPRRQRRGALP